MPKKLLKKYLFLHQLYWILSSMQNLKKKVEKKGTVMQYAKFVRLIGDAKKIYWSSLTMKENRNFIQQIICNCNGNKNGMSCGEVVEMMIAIAMVPKQNKICSIWSSLPIQATTTCQKSWKIDYFPDEDNTIQYHDNCQAFEVAWHCWFHTGGNGMLEFTITRMELI